MKVRVPKDAGGPSLSSLKQMQRLQADIETKQEELAVSTYDASSGGGAVKVTVTGKRRIESIKIDRDVIDADDVETLEDLICAAVNEAIELVDKASEEEMGKLTGNISLPGLF